MSLHTFLDEDDLDLHCQNIFQIARLCSKLSYFYSYFSYSTGILIYLVEEQSVPEC